MINRLLLSERAKWIFVIGVVAISSGFTAKNIISYPIECKQDELVKDFFLPNKNARISPFPRFYSLKKSKKLLHL
tara:strand:- start:508 stop:732 length:225 start_codon:yes stop_codon:yes gene_type:complete